MDFCRVYYVFDFDTNDRELLRICSLQKHETRTVFICVLLETT